LLYIILLIVVISIGYVYISARERLDVANDIQSERKLSNMKKKYAAADEIVYPSWIDDDNLVQAFKTLIINGANKKGIPTPFVLEALKNIEMKRLKECGQWKRVVLLLKNRQRLLQKYL